LTIDPAGAGMQVLLLFENCLSIFISRAGRRIMQTGSSRPDQPKGDNKNIVIRLYFS
jgi:hypothetical protein